VNHRSRRALRAIAGTTIAANGVNFVLALIILTYKIKYG
jgi:uncharacterized protein with PQ loop repeat